MYETSEAHHSPCPRSCRCQLTFIRESEDDNCILSGVLQFGSRGCFDGFNYCPTAVLLGCLLFYGMYYVHGI